MRSASGTRATTSRLRTPTYANSAIWANDSWQQSMMSYWSQTENTSISASFAHLISPMAVD